MSIKHAGLLRSVEAWYSHLDREAVLPGRRTRLDDFGLLCLLGFYARLNGRML